MCFSLYKMAKKASHIFSVVQFEDSIVGMIVILIPPRVVKGTDMNKALPLAQIFYRTRLVILHQNFRNQRQK